MEIFILIVLAFIGFIAYRFFTYRKEAVSQFDKDGGLYGAFSNFIEVFKNSGFHVSQNKPDTVILKRDINGIKSIVQILVLSKSEVRIICQTEAMGEKHVFNDRSYGPDDQIEKAENALSKIEANERAATSG